MIIVIHVNILYIMIIIKLFKIFIKFLMA